MGSSSNYNQKVNTIRPSCLVPPRCTSAAPNGGRVHSLCLHQGPVRKGPPAVVIYFWRLMRLFFFLLYFFFPFVWLPRPRRLHGFPRRPVFRPGPVAAFRRAHGRPAVGESKPARLRCAGQSRANRIDGWPVVRADARRDAGPGEVAWGRKTAAGWG